MGWVFLASAILLEVAGTTAMKLSDGLTRPGYAVAMFVLYALAFAALALSIRTVALGVAYAVWAGVGTALIAGIAALSFGEPLGTTKVVSIGLLVAGVVGLHLD